MRFSRWLPSCKHSYVTLRLILAERARLENLAAVMAIGASARACVFAEQSTPGKKRPLSSIENKKAAAEPPARLGQSRIVSNLIQQADYQRRLISLLHELFLSHDWNVSRGPRDTARRDPLNYKRQTQSKPKRLQGDPKQPKAMFRGCCETSEPKAGLEAAVEEQELFLAQSDRRGFVAVDADGKVWSLSRWCSVKPREMRGRLGSEMDLPWVEDAGIVFVIRQNKLSICATLY